MQNKFGVWCNGNTADSGPAFPGSSPGTPTKTNRQVVEVQQPGVFFYPLSFYEMLFDYVIDALRTCRGSCLLV